MATGEPDGGLRAGKTPREAEIGRLTRQVMEEDAELLERLGRGPSVVDDEMPRENQATKPLKE